MGALGQNGTQPVEKEEKQMLPDRVFFIMTAIVTLAEIFAVCYFWERKMLQAEKQARREERRRARGYRD